MAAPDITYSLSDDPTKNIVVIINDYYEEYGQAFQKLSKRLGRPLRGVLLVNKILKDAGRNLADNSGIFEEVVCDFSSDAELRAAVRRFEKNLLLVTCVGESSQMDFQRVLPHAPYVPAPSERSLEWATHKGKMREVIGAYDDSLVPKMQATVSAADEEIAKVLRKFTFPMMVKPTGLSDSTLVAKVHSETELRSALHKSFAALHEAYERNRGNGKPGIIVEEFMEGEQFTIDGYVNERGKVWLLPLLHSKSAYHMGLEGFYTYQTETYHELTQEEEVAGKRAAEAAIHAIGLRASVAHMDMLKTADGWKIIEIGARPGGLRHEMYEVSYGVNHAFNELLVKVGLEPEMDNGRLVHSMVFKVYPESEGEIYAIEGVDEARFNPSVYKVDQFAKPGDEVLPVTKGGSVAVQGLVFNNDVAQLRKDVAHIRSTIKLKTDQPTAIHPKSGAKKGRLHSVV